MFNDFEKKIPMGEKEETQQMICPFCGTYYSSNNAKIILGKENFLLLHSRCQICGSSIIAALITNQIGVSSIGLITDLTFEDAVKFKENKAVSPDEVLDVYTIFESKNEGLPSLLN